MSNQHQKQQRSVSPDTPLIDFDSGTFQDVFLDRQLGNPPHTAISISFEFTAI